MKTKALKILVAVFCVLIIVLTICSCGEDKAEYSDKKLVDAIDDLNSSAENNEEYILISFPGLGIDAQTINKTAFNLFNKVTVYWYGILITIGIILAFAYSYFISKREGIKTDDLLDMAIWAVVSAVVGARLYYVLTSIETYKGRFWDIFKIWEGGIAIYGAIIGGAIAIAIVCFVKKISILKSYDTIAPAVMIGQIIGRWGNFMNGEAFGYQIREGSSLYWLRMGVYSNASRALGESGIIYVHPTFLYESLWNLIGFILINLICVRKKKFDGQVFFSYIAWYGLGRTFIELLRTDSLYIFGSIRISSLVGCLCFFVGTAMLIYGAIKGKKARLAGEAYESAYPLFHSKSVSTTVSQPQVEQPENNDDITGNETIVENENEQVDHNEQDGDNKNDID